jgi:hypothetical protein
MSVTLTRRGLLRAGFTTAVVGVALPQLGVEVPKGWRWVRGVCRDEPARTCALEAKQLAGAALDVWEGEPVDRTNPLLQNAVHFSSPAVAQVRRRVARVLAGQRPLYGITPEVYASGAVRRAR